LIIHKFLGQALAQGVGNRDIIEMVTTIIMVYKFTQLTRTEVDAMSGVTLQETRVYQEAKAEGKVEGKVEGKLEGKAEGKAQGKLEMLLMLLNHNFGSLPDDLTKQIKILPIERLESLCTASFNFQKLSDITTWLESLLRSLWQELPTLLQNYWDLSTSTLEQLP
jgi:predicted transposase YdaD